MVLSKGPNARLSRKGLIGGFKRGNAPSPQPVYPRTATPETATLLFAGHSFTQTGWGGLTSDGYHGGILYTDWPGATLSDFVPFGSAQQVWELNGNLRNSPYDVVICSEVTTDFTNGFPSLDSASAANTMQYLYWYGQKAAERNAEQMLLQVWSPDGAFHLDPGAAVFFEGIRRWLIAKLGRPVWTIPAGQYVAALRAAGYSVYTDGLHLHQQFGRGLSYMEYSMLTQKRCPFVRAGDEAIDEIGWNILQTYECAGMGGATVINVPAYTDPLPNPVPLGGAQPMNHSSFVARSINVSKQSADSLEFVSNSSDTRRTATWQSLPVGTRIQFTVETTATLYFRGGVDNGLGTGGYTELVSPNIPAGTTNVDITISANPATYPRFGILSPSVPTTVKITNWKVTLPASSAPVVSVPAGAVVSTFDKDGQNWTQVLLDNISGSIDVSGDVAGAYLALVPPGGAGGRTAGPGTRAGGGAGGLPRFLRNATLLAGAYTLTQGTPGTGATGANGWGLSATDSTLTGPINLTAPGGAGGGGNVTGQNAGRDGGNGGGGMGANTTAYPGGVSTSDGYPGGAGYANADNTLKSGGGGGGAGGAGATGTSGVGGLGGLGVPVEFMNPVRRVAGGAGGSGQTQGQGQDGGTAATNGARSLDADFGAGSGACIGFQPGRGGLPFFVLVFPTVNATVNVKV